MKIKIISVLFAVSLNANAINFNIHPIDYKSAFSIDSYNSLVFDPIFKADIDLAQKAIFDKCMPMSQPEKSTCTMDYFWPIYERLFKRKTAYNYYQYGAAYVKYLQYEMSEYEAAKLRTGGETLETQARRVKFQKTSILWNDVFLPIFWCINEQSEECKKRFREFEVPEDDINTMYNLK